MAARQMPAWLARAVAEADPGERALAATAELNEALERQRKRQGVTARELARLGFPAAVHGRPGLPRMTILW
jgi:hypothetical protein